MSTQLPPIGYERNRTYYHLNFLYVGVGGLVIILNAPLALYLLKIVKKTQKELIIIIALAVSDILGAIQFFSVGVYRLLVWFEHIDFIPRTECNLRPTIISFAICIQMDNLYQLNIAIDRLFATLLPVKYRQTGQAYTFLLITTPLIFSLCSYLLHLHFIFNSPLTYIDGICFNIDTFLFAYRRFLAYQRISCVVIPSIIYIYIYLKMTFKFHTFGNDRKHISKGMKHLTNTVAFTTFVAVFLVLIPEIIYQFGVFGGIDSTIYFSAILLRKVVSFFIHTVRHREFMQQISWMLPRKLTVAAARFQIHSQSSKVVFPKIQDRITKIHS